jgi:rhodanese-related sulfurtransferase
MKKGPKQLVAEANAAIKTWSVADAIAAVGREDVAFVDIREADEQREGMVPGAESATRGMLEWYADADGPYHKPVLSSGKTLVMYCAGGGRSALACKTLHDMGIENVVNLAGGFTAWRAAGGPVDTTRALGNTLDKRTDK